MSDRARHRFVLVFVIALVLASLVVIVGIPGVVKAKKTRLGLDLQGGVELIFQARPGPDTPVSSAAIANSINIIRSRVDTLGVNQPLITQSGSNEIEIQLPNVKSAQQAETLLGATGQLFFYDWEESVIGANGHVAGATGESADGDPSSSTSTSLPGIADYLTEYQAVLRGEKRPAIPSTTAGFKLESAPQGSYYYVNPKTQTVIVGPESGTRGQAIGFLHADLAQKNRTLPAGAKLAFVPPGTVLVQAASGPDAAIPDAFYVLQDKPFLTGDQISNPQATQDPTQGEVVSFGFKNGGAGIFQNETLRLAKRGANNSPVGFNNFQHFAVTLGGSGSSSPVLVTVPQIDFTQFPNGIPSGSGSEITGDFTYSSATQLANTLASGALPLKLVPISSVVITATLGHQSLNQGLLAGLVGLALVALFLLVFYRVLGIIAVVALATYALYFYALIKLIPVTLTLPGIAGLILTIGVAADANVVIFERVKEESRAGRSPANAIVNGYRRGFAAIVDANVVTFMTAFILFILSQADVQGFALTLGVGVLVSLFTAVAATRAVLGTMGRTRLIAHRSALGVSGRHRRWTFDFMGNSKWFFTMSGTILLVGALAIGGRGLNFGIDFVSGTQITTALERPATSAKVSSLIQSLHLKSSSGGSIGVPTVQETSSSSTTSRKVVVPAKGKGKKATTKTESVTTVTHAFQITTKTLPDADIGTNADPGPVYRALNTNFGVKDLNYTTVGASFGRTVEDSAVIAIIASLLAISVYITLRFQWKYAVPTLIALMHDLLITAGVYALTGREVTADTVAALLTILGYSLYDTIIVFDRVRENVQKMPNAAFSQIVNRSMSEVLTRSLATSLCTLLPILALLLFGGTTLRDFAFALLVGVASGAYSSIFIASPVLVHWKEREPVYRRRRARIAAENGGVVPAYATTGAAARETDVEASRRRERARLTSPTRADGTISTGEFREMVRELAPEPRPRTRPEPPPPDPTADARPEDVVMPDQPARSRGAGASKSRGRRRGRPR
jgi:SecD/SecF fusion protein